MKRCKLRVRVTPRGGADRIDGIETDETGRPLVRLRVRAAPDDGEANQAVIALLAKSLKLARSAVGITSGHSARIKTVEIDGLDKVEVLDRLLT